MHIVCLILLFAPFLIWLVHVCSSGVVMAEVDEVEPLDSLPGCDQDQGFRNSFAATPLPGGATLSLTDAGIRAIIGRKFQRPKPLVERFCIGCGRSTWSRDRFVKTDFLEWSPGYYRLTAKMKSLGVRDEQPTGGVVVSALLSWVRSA